MPLIPSRLKIGDTIGVVTPSGPISSSPSDDPYLELERGLAYLRDLGFKTLLGEHALQEGGLAAGSPQERAGDLNAMFANPEVSAIISTHGGVAANSCLPLLDYELIQAQPKILLGFSDISTLHLGIYSQTDLVTFHGNMVMYYFGMEPQEYDRQEFLSRLILGEIGPVNKNSPWRTLRGEGSVEGRLLGGNDWVMQWLLGTPYWPDFSGAILFIEVPGYSPDMLVNRLNQFKQAGLFEQIRGVLIGYAKKVEDYPVEDIFLEVTAEDNFPILKTDDFGHHCPNTVLPVGVNARLDADTSTLELLEPCVE
ncbi:MAG: LD-carboxypeptidase [Chloroflexota bacterium]|nr:MAG: LD-carboxypeptidase [Chloroflexota bacterium]